MADLTSGRINPLDVDEEPSSAGDVVVDDGTDFVEGLEGLNFSKLALLVTGRALSHIQGRPVYEEMLLKVAKLCRVVYV